MTNTLIDSTIDLMGASPAPQIRSTAKHPASNRVPIKHLLIGAPIAVTHTIHRLHQVRYAEATAWSTLLVLPNEPLIIQPDAGDVLAMLVRYLNLESGR